MTATTLVAIAVPGVAVAVCLALRGKLPNLVADVRGIALQTVIIMVVLLAIAGGVAAVLLNRGGEAVTDIERQQISREASEFSGSSLCNAAGYVWSSAGANQGCNAVAGPSLIAQQKAAAKNAAKNKATCEAISGAKWKPTAGNTDPDNNGTCT